jgi:hypothetical protein
MTLGLLSESAQAMLGEHPRRPSALVRGLPCLCNLATIDGSARGTSLGQYLNARHRSTTDPEDGVAPQDEGSVRSDRSTYSGSYQVDEDSSGGTDDVSNTRTEDNALG